MDESELILQEFFVEGKARDTSHVLLHITEPTTPAEKKVGYFFAVAEVENGSIEHIEHIQTMIDDLESGIYETDSTKEKTSFEATVEYINKRGHHLLSYEGNSHIIVGIINGQDIQFAYHGNVAAQLIYQETSGAHTALNIIGDEPEHTTQLFSAVLEGSMNPGDYFFVATPHVLPLIEHKLANMLPAAPPKQTAATIDTLARSTDKSLSYGGIIATIVPEPEVDEQDDAPIPVQSISDRVRVEDSVREVVRPSLIPKRTNQKKEPRPAPSLRKKREPTGDLPLGNQMLVLLGKAIVVVLKFLFAIFMRIIILIKNLCVNGFILATNIGGQRQYIIDTITRRIHDTKRSYERLPLMSKILFFATIIVAIVFVGSILMLRAKEAREVALASYVNTVQAIIDKRDAAESSLIYNDSERAFILLEEARGMIASLPEKSDTERTRKQELTTDIESLLVSLRNITVVTPEVIADLKQTNPSANATKLVRIGSTVVAYGPNDGAHYPINMNTKSVETRDHSTLGSLGAADAPKEYDYATFFTGPTSIATLNPESFTLSSATIGAPVETTLVDLTIYNRRAYTLSPSNNQIYRHSPTQTGFDGGSVWLTSPADLLNAVAITIDGEVFVLKSTGEILKFFGGSPVPFAVTGLDPILTAPTDIWTYADVPYIYVLEPKENRLVLLNKDGSLSIQYTAEVWNEPEAFVVNEETNEVYVLDDNIVYRFSTR